MNAFVAIGSINSDGTLTIGTPIQLSDFAPGIMAWDTAVAINRTNKNNIVVSYGVLNNTASPHTYATYRAVSFDGGKTWPINGPTQYSTNGIPSCSLAIIVVLHLISLAIFGMELLIVMTILAILSINLLSGSVLMEVIPILLPILHLSYIWYYL